MDHDPKREANQRKQFPDLRADLANHNGVV